MKRNWIWLMAVLLMACSPNQVEESSAELYHTEIPLKAKFDLPSEVLPEQEMDMGFLLTQNGKPVENLTNVKLRIWQDQHEDKAVEVIVPYAQDGWYRTNMTLEEDGIYYMQLVANTETSSIMPTKRFIAGELTSEELEQLEKSSKTEPEEHHHGEHH
ncbi:hypothetical protein F9U64_07800 [Gracilibacillus oryzae]|uniref:YtkA-like domain-containing protein n=1 Tax=Gracilibacillus oryzae TaxID=1672701 RepID=A0A7C8KSS3_9BACI|nr:FixH family protein [Gracilibacillus oryzae]KAB8137829.1 hypothetical protein F9U64_07800 [Gracilibacillus oryzae]